jgi:hypothetical protein
MAESNELVFNVAFTVPINDDPAGPILTLEEFWRGLRRGGEKPHLFAEYVADTEVLPGRKSENEFTRRLIMADGAVHTAKGVALEQNVRNADNLLVRMRTLREASSTADHLSCRRRKPSLSILVRVAQCSSRAEAENRISRRTCS